MLIIDNWIILKKSNLMIFDYIIF